MFRHKRVWIQSACCRLWQEGRPLTVRALAPLGSLHVAALGAALLVVVDAQRVLENFTLEDDELGRHWGQRCHQWAGVGHVGCCRGAGCEWGVDHTERSRRRRRRRQTGDQQRCADGSMRHGASTAGCVEIAACRRATAARARMRFFAPTAAATSCTPRPATISHLHCRCS